jgi:hypothetical protein
MLCHKPLSRSLIFHVNPASIYIGCRKSGGPVRGVAAKGVVQGWRKAYGDFSRLFLHLVAGGGSGEVSGNMLVEVSADQGPSKPYGYDRVWFLFL